MRVLILTLVLLIFCLFGIAYFYLGAKWHHREFLDSDDIINSAYVYRGLPYTLNYSQHQAVLTLLNNAKKVPKGNGPFQEERLVLYLFKRKDPLILQPMSPDYSRFSVSLWQKHDLQISEPGKLKEILQTTYDPLD